MTARDKMSRHFIGTGAGRTLRRGKMLVEIQDFHVAHEYSDTQVPGVLSSISSTGISDFFM